MSTVPFAHEQDIEIALGSTVLQGVLGLVPASAGLVVFVHGSGSSRFSSRNRAVARDLQSRGLSTLLFDLLSPDEERLDAMTAEFRFDIGLLTERVVGATEWLGQQPETAGLGIGYFGPARAAAAPEAAVTLRISLIGACVVSRGGRPDLAMQTLPLVVAPTLLIVGGDDHLVIQMNQRAFTRLTAIKDLQIVPGASHLFEEPGALEEVSRLAREWFLRYLSG
jgi:pimeloyl-ACP methyl ester carboxylesterase